MTKRIVGSSCAAALLACAVAALGQTSSQAPTQSPVQGNTQTPPTAQRSTASPRIATDRYVTIVGCVERAPSAASTSTGANDFILANATMSTETAHPSANAGAAATSDVAGTTGSATAGAAGTTGSSSAGASTPRSGSTTTGIAGPNGTSYALSGSAAADLSKYVGQRVAVIGKVDRGAEEKGGQAHSVGGADRAGATDAPMPRVSITSLKPMAGACS